MPEFSKVIVKVGSNVLTTDDGLLNVKAILSIVSQLVKLHQRGVKVILVSSGAVASGRELLALQHEEDSISRRQILASLGQAKLMHEYYTAFSTYGINCSQVLVSREDFRDRKHYKNMQNCLSALWRNDIIPIVNENDVVSITELMFTDNDQLAGMLTSMTSSKALIILTNVDGVYDKNPSDATASVIEKLQCDEDLTIKESTSSLGRGGMKAKLKTAQTVASMGAEVFITNGYKEDSIVSVFSNDFYGTHVFSGKQESDDVRWLVHTEPITISSIEVNELTVKSLLTEGKMNLYSNQIVSVNERFEVEDIVKIVDAKGNRLGIGMASLASDELFSTSNKLVIDSDFLYLNRV